MKTAQCRLQLREQESRCSTKMKAVSANTETPLKRPQDDHRTTTALKATTLNRRQLLSYSALAALSLAGCGSNHLGRPARIGTNLWPGFEFLYLARERGFFLPQEVRLVDMHSARSLVHNLAAENLEGACMSLDVALAAKSQGLDIEVVAILDISNGADTLLVQPSIARIADLKGKRKRIGLEPTGLGAIMLQLALSKADLSSVDVTQVHLQQSQHTQALLREEVYAVITYEPSLQHLLDQDARLLFSSREIPNQIIDVLVVRRNSLEQHRHNFQQLLRGHVLALEDYRQHPQEAAAILSHRLLLPAEQLPTILEGIKFPDLREIRRLLLDKSARLSQRAEQFIQILLSAGLADHALNPHPIFNGRLLPSQL